MADPGSLIANGFQNLAQGMDNYQKLQQADSAASGQINAFLAQGPQAIASLSPAGQDLMQKQMEGNLKYKDRLQLLGEITTSQTLRQQRQEYQIRNIQLQKWQAMQQLIAQSQQQDPSQGQGAPPDPSALAAAAPPGAMPSQGMPPQGAAPQGAPPPADPTQQPPAPVSPSSPPPPGVGQFLPQQPQVLVAPPAPVKITDPRVVSMLPKALAMTDFDPGKASDLMQKQVDAMNAQQKQQYDAKAQAEAPTGNLYFKTIEYKDGMPQYRVFTPEVIVGKGTASQSFKESPTEVKVPWNSPIPGNVVHRGNREMDNESAGAAPNNTNDPVWQKEIQGAYQNAASSNNMLATAKLLSDAADAYTADPSNGSKINALLGTPAGGRLKQFFTGTNTQAGLQMALSSNVKAVMEQLRNQDGNVGGRITGQEWQKTYDQLGEGTMPNETLLAAAHNMLTLADRTNNINQAYARYRETMPSGEAQALAIKQFGAQPKLAVPAAQQPPVMMRRPDGQVGNIPAGNVQKALAQGYVLVQ